MTHFSARTIALVLYWGMLPILVLCIGLVLWTHWVWWVVLAILWDGALFASLFRRMNQLYPFKNLFRKD